MFMYNRAAMKRRMMAVIAHIRPIATAAFSVIGVAPISSDEGSRWRTSAVATKHDDMEVVNECFGTSRERCGHAVLGVICEGVSIDNLC